MGTEARGTSGSGRLIGMNGLRGVAALCILTTHVWDYGTPNGGPGRINVSFLHPAFAVLGLAVTLFFTLSGFLLYRRFAAGIIGGSGRPSVREYGRARILRIIPAYWVILSIVGLIFGAVLVPTPNSGRALGSLVEHPHALIANYVFAQNYAPATNITGIGSAWTLLNEAVFYVALPVLALPLIYLATRARLQRTRIGLAFAAPLVLLIGGLTCKAFGQIVLHLDPQGGWDPDWRSVFERSWFYQADLFAAGMSAAALSVLVQHGMLRVSSRMRTLALAASAGIFLVIPVLGRHGMYPGVLVNTTVSISFGLLLLALATTGTRSRLAGVLQWRPLASVGLISYSLFLWHEPVVRWLSAHGVTQYGRFGLALNILLVASISVFLATITYLLVERPFMAMRRRAPRPRTPVAAPARADAATAVAAPAPADAG
jgi:peptidoglycan/LPS O-acetylase OafA/YrhL